MARQWRRAIKLTVSSDGKKLDLSNLRVTFRIEQKTLQHPNVAYVRVYNMSREHSTWAKTLKEGGKLVLEAGYEDNIGVLFRGEIKQVESGRESPTDTYVKFAAAEGDRGYNKATVNKTLKAGSTAKDVVDEAVKALKKYDLKDGKMPKDVFEKMKYPRPFVMYGMARDYLRYIDNTFSTMWSIQKDRIDIVKSKEGPEEGDTVILNSRTGLIGRPIQESNGGILARALINPKFDVNQKVKIDEASVERADMNLTYTGDKFNALPYLPPVAADGLYWIASITWIGDSRGTAWYADLECNAMSQPSLTKGQIARGISPS